jgi:hypothetical protein
MGATLPMLPGYGQPCNGCGCCCREELCGMAVEILGANATAPCPYLTEHHGRTWCGVVEVAAKHDVAFAGYLGWRLGFGVGCIVRRDEAQNAATSNA